MEPDGRKLEIIEPARVPWKGLILGWGAMLPLGFCAGWAWMGDADGVDAAREAARLWGAALLLFFSGVRRGLSFGTKGGPKAAQLLVFALLFSAGLSVLLMPLSWALGLLTVAFAGLGVADTRASRRGRVPLYFARLRP